jgi:myosin heavy subunit
MAVSKLLQIDERQLRDALCFSMLYMKDETVKRHYHMAQAIDNRDAMAKTLYGRLFGWIVFNINKLLAPQKEKAKGPVARRPNSDAKPGIIGILDIFGFEHFAENRFEQWCINLANEQLQHFFNQHVFQLELEEYAKEGVNGANISYVDNKPLLVC